MMLVEHEQGRSLTRALRSAAQRLESAIRPPRRRSLDHARGYSHLLRQHIMKEDRILFPMADQVLPPSEQDRVETDLNTSNTRKPGRGSMRNICPW